VLCAVAYVQQHAGFFLIRKKVAAGWWLLLPDIDRPKNMRGRRL
jgi:hypothetical protein